MTSAWSKYTRGVKFSAILLSAVLVGAYFALQKHSRKKTEVVIQFEDDFKYFPDLMPRFSRDMLADDFESCLYSSILGGIDLKNSEEYNGSYAFSKEMNSLSTALTDFADLMQSLRVKAVLIEPSVIHCMLSQENKQMLLKRKFQPEKYLLTDGIVTFGIREKYVSNLVKNKTRSQIAASNFTLEFIQDPASPWMQKSHNENSTNHLFFLRGSFVVHVVVFHKRGSFLWHAGIRSQSNSSLPSKELLYFADLDSAYDSFFAVDPGFNLSTSLLVPSDPGHLLLQISTSGFLECNEDVLKKFRNEKSAPHSPVALHRLEVRTAAALSALKNRLSPLFMRFFLSGGTLLGWYRQCGLIPYTSDVDFGAWAEEVDDLQALLQLFQDDGHLRLREIMGVVDEGLEFNLNYDRLRVDLFFMYPESNGTWYAGHRPSKKYYFKYHHPKFTLCSADLLRRRVLVPCETERVLETEYGPNWLKPVKKWNYEKSIFNRGPNIYWKKSMRDKVYYEEY